MATQELDISQLTSESQQVIQLIRQGHSFLLSGGAGSGKTYSLVEVLKAVLVEKPTSSIACITYTNAAVHEIEERVQHDQLHVSTIHDFLWRNIKHFQCELKCTLIELMNDDEQPKIKSPDGETVAVDFFNELESDIKYKEFVKIKDGCISHDEVLILACKMYEKYEKLCTITKDSYPLILVDEYQDTDPNVVKLLLEHLNQSPKNNIVGFFGDAMQSIYPGSVGNLNEYTQQVPPRVTEVKKVQNRRNPQLVIDLANKIRTDGLLQEPSKDINAPNMNADGTAKQGTALFLYSNNDDLDVVRHNLAWDFDDSTKTKELNLTHNLIAGKAGFDDLMRIYDKDKVLEFIKRVKGYIKKDDNKIETEGKTFKQVYGELGGLKDDVPKLLAPTKGQREYIDANPQAYHFAFEQPYDEISKLYIDKDMLLDDKKNNAEDLSKPASKRDDLIKHLFKIEHCIHLYKEKRFNEFSRITDFSITSVEDKKCLKESMDALIEVEERSIGDVIGFASTLNLVVVDDKLERFQISRNYVYQQICQIPYQQFRDLYQYLEGYTPFSTQHKTKGAEYSNVLVVLDNGKWNSYNFNYLFEGNGNDNVRHKTEKIFYVCCTRAKENLAVFFHQPSANVIAKASEWFGVDNIVNLDEI
ncbi:DNA/RNA helicase [Colwellia sp. MT41]|uniref:UvrD-helicase domain-containing protein n=1 Tax=Colwellia sp. MT41 TaxID=58049 RepID=UPI000717A695|nr:UvrD-helicase domain-containing protein [Colwellia sp. MT41]ALO34908.1 DNA/RNA helicase [Colwellia sp. MT41]